MRSRRRVTTRCACALAAALMVLAAAAQAAAAAQVRFVHALPDGERATLTAAAGGEERPLGTAGFAEFSQPVEVPSGSVRLRLSAQGEGQPLAELEETLGEGSYTVVAQEGDDGPELRVYRDARAQPGAARVRVIHASPELGDPDVRLGGTVLAERVPAGDATPYVSVEPGSYGIRATRPGSDDAVASGQVSLSAGTASTAVIVGTRGEATRIVAAADDAVTPAGAPATGGGGLTGDDERWLVVLLAALAGGALGAAAWRLAGAGRRSKPGR